jgi:hypothetical protein
MASHTEKTSSVQLCRMEPVCLLGSWWITPVLRKEYLVCVCCGGRVCLSAVLTCSFKWVIIACSVAGPRCATLRVCAKEWGTVCVHIRERTRDRQWMRIRTVHTTYLFCVFSKQCVVIVVCIRLQVGRTIGGHQTHHRRCGTAWTTSASSLCVWVRACTHVHARPTSHKRLEYRVRIIPVISQEKKTQAHTSLFPHCLHKPSL